MHHILKLVCAPCIMHMCVISTMFGSCFWFLKKTFIFSNNRWSPSPSVLHISHSGSLFCWGPPPGPSHFSLRVFTSSSPQPSPSHVPLRFFNPSSPPLPGPSHFSLRFINPSSPPPSVLRISHSGSLWRRHLVLSPGFYSSPRLPN
jgi:hypothetical protein